MQLKSHFPIPTQPLQIQEGPSLPNNLFRRGHGPITPSSVANESNIEKTENRL